MAKAEPVLSEIVLTEEQKKAYVQKRQEDVTRRIDGFTKDLKELEKKWDVVQMAIIHNNRIGNQITSIHPFCIAVDKQEFENATKAEKK